MKIAVMGTGAMGGYIGARLAAAGAEVVFIARGAHLAAIRKDGLKVTSPLGDVHINPATATDDPAQVGPVDLVLLGVKLYDVAAAITASLPLLGPETGVISLQNGVEAPTMIAEIAGTVHAIPGVALINGEIIEPGVIQHNAMNGLTVGEIDGRASGRLERLVALGRKGGLNVTLSPDIRLELWRKLLLLTPMAGLSAMTRVPMARLRETPATWRLAAPAMAEVVAVAQAEGVGLAEADIENTLAFVQGMAPTWQASLTVDLERGKRLELDWLHGSICRLGEKHGIATPFHRVVLGALMPHANGAA
ncbi:MAG: 2-dehydropantoate 2-reductase [Alphaproteobacteria bacterium]|nr:2-dehydropantoate 2-reductase [Alphaproteobacteria bacterium]